MTAVNIAANNVSGDRGIEASYAGTGIINITTAGTVDAQQLEGILTTTTGTGTTINVSSATVNSSNNTAITTNNAGGGTTSIVATNAIMGKHNGISAIDTTATGKINIGVNQKAVVNGNTSGISIAPLAVPR